MPDDEHWGALGEAVAARRKALALAQEDVASKGGPSAQTMRLIERGKGGQFRPSTFHKLDRALEWLPGTSTRILAGESDDDAAGDEIARRIGCGLVIRPGDRVLIGLTKTTLREGETIRDALRERFPGVEFTFVAGVSVLAVMPTGDEADDGAAVPELHAPNYAQAVLDRLDRECPGLEPDLARLYALLALTLGTFTTLEDVHDAWSIWTNTTNPQHRSLIPFDELAPEVQELDRQFMDAVHRAAKAVPAEDEGER